MAGAVEFKVAVDCGGVGLPEAIFALALVLALVLALRRDRERARSELGGRVAIATSFDGRVVGSLPACKSVAALTRDDGLEEGEEGRQCAKVVRTEAC